MITDNVVKQSGKFSFRARLRSFSYAWGGVVYFFRTEHNAQIHLAATFLVIFLSVILHVNRVEAFVLLFAVALVWITEMLNTAIEKTMDFITMDQHPSIKIIKDVSAAAVFVASIAAFIAGLFIFIPKILAL